MTNNLARRFSDSTRSCHSSRRLRNVNPQTPQDLLSLLAPSCATTHWIVARSMNRWHARHANFKSRARTMDPATSPHPPLSLCLTVLPSPRTYRPWPSSLLLVMQCPYHGLPRILDVRCLPCCATHLLFTLSALYFVYVFSLRQFDHAATTPKGSSGPKWFQTLLMDPLRADN